MKYYNHYGKLAQSGRYALAKTDDKNFWLRIHPLYDTLVNIKERFLVEEMDESTKWQKVSEETFTTYLQFLQTRNSRLYHRAVNMLENKIKSKGHKLWQKNPVKTNKLNVIE